MDGWCLWRFHLGQFTSARDAMGPLHRLQLGLSAWVRENSQCVFVSSHHNGLKMVVPCCSIYVVFCCLFMSSAWNDFFCQVKLTGLRCFGQKYTFLKNTLHPIIWNCDKQWETFALSTREMKMQKWPYWMRKIANHPLLPVAFVRSKVCWVRVKASASVEWHTKLDEDFECERTGCFFSVPAMVKSFSVVFQIPSLKYDCS